MAGGPPPLNLIELPTWLKTNTGAAPPTPPAAGGGGPGKVGAALAFIEASNFGKTAEGLKVVQKIKDLQAAGKISYASMSASTRGSWGSGEIKVNDTYTNDVDATASELVHEATHALNEDEFPASKTKVTIDEEFRTNKNQIDLYEEQRAGGFRDPELERRRTADQAGTLRDDVRNRYPGVPEHL
jgi:hypothetical protein